MKVSVLVPIYGVERYIAHCAETLFRQSYDNIEYIFVDDATPDNSIGVLNDVLSQFPERQQQVRIIHHEHNRGLGAARLTALQAATGDYVMHVDSDDALPDDAVSVLVGRAQQTHCDIIDGGYEVICRDKVVSRHMPYHGSKGSFLRLMLCQNIVLSMVWARLYRRELYFEHDVLPIEGIDNAEDLAIVPRIYFFATRAVTDHVVYHYRDDNATSYTNAARSEKAMRSYLRANSVVFKFYQDTPGSTPYGYPLQLGYLNVLRDVRSNGFPLQWVDELCPLRPRNIFVRLMAGILRSRCPLSLANVLYLCLRKLYEIKVRHAS